MFLSLVMGNAFYVFAVRQCSLLAASIYCKHFLAVSMGTSFASFASSYGFFKWETARKNDFPVLSILTMSICQMYRVIQFKLKTIGEKMNWSPNESAAENIPNISMKLFHFFLISRFFTVHKCIVSTIWRL